MLEFRYIQLDDMDEFIQRNVLYTIAARSADSVDLDIIFCQFLADGAAQNSRGSCE